MESRLQHIENVYKNNLAELFHYNAFNEGKESIEDLFVEITLVCEEYIKQTNQSQTLSNEITNNFLKLMLPIFIEIFLRRKTEREHEVTLYNLFMTVARLLAQPIIHDIIELNELRNFLFQNVLSSNLKFITLKHIKLPNSITNNYIAIPMTSGFFHEFGKPNICINGNDVVFFWPDEWMTLLGKSNSIGHYICIYLKEKSIWREGKVTEYDLDNDLYIISLDPVIDNMRIVKGGVYDDQIQTSSESVQETETLSVHILKQQYLITRKTIFGKVVSFKNFKHGILFENGDIREYDIRNIDYEVIDPKLYNEIIKTGISDVNNVRQVAQLFQNRKEEIILTTTSSSTSAGNISQLDVVQRPDPSHSSHMSYYYINMINVFIQEDGFRHFYYRMSDSTSSPISCKILLYYVQFIYQLRHTLGINILKDIIWEAKEGVTYSLSRYSDLQFKELVQNDFYDILLLIKELIIFLYSLNNANQQTNNLTANIRLINESIDQIRLTISLKLLQCSLISKKYLGLSIIKEYIDILQPKLSSYTSKRLQYLSQTKNGRYAKPIEKADPNVTNQPRNITNYQHSLSNTSITVQDLIHWLIKNKVIEEIFVNGSIHQDLAMKSDVILIFLSYRKSITESHLETIWQSCKGAHEAVVKVIHNLILLIIPVLEHNLRIKLFMYISNVSYKEYNETLLYFIKCYTVQALIKSKEEIRQTSENSNSPIKESIQTNVNMKSTDSLNLFDDYSSNEINLNNNTSQYNNINRKGLVVSAPSKQWMGFGVLWQFIQDPSISSTLPSSSFDAVDESLFDLAIQLLVELLQNEFMDERERVMSRCIELIRLGVSVPGSLQLLRRTLGTYPSSIKSWLFPVSVSNRGNNQIKTPTITSQIEKFQKNEKLLDVLFMDIDRYHKSLLDYMKKSPSNPNISTMTASSNISSNRNINNTRIQMNGKISRTSYIKGVIERLDFLKFILLKSTITLTEEQIMILWNAFGEGAVSIETFDKFMNWLDSLIGKNNKTYCYLLKLLSLDNDFMNPTQSSKITYILLESNDSGLINANTDDEIINNVIFEDEILIKLFNYKIINYVTKRENIDIISRLSIGSLLIKYFILVNMLNKSIRVDIETDSWYRVGPLSGLTIMWRIAMDCTDIKLSDAAIYLIVELHQCMPNKFRYSNSIRSYLMRLCFVQLSTCVQSLRIEDTVNSPTDTNAISELIKSNVNNASTVQIPKVTLNLNSDDSNVGSKTTSTRAILGEEGYPIIVQTTATVPRPLKLPDTPPIAIMTGCDDWFDDGDGLLDHQIFSNRISRLIYLMRLFIYRFTYSPTQFITIKVLAGREDAVVLSLRMLSTDTISNLRQKIGNHFKEPSHLITLIKDKSKNVNNNSIGTIFTNAVERYDRDDITLKNAKLVHNDCVVAKKKDVSNVATANPNPNSNNTSSAHGETIVDVINPDDLITNILEVLDPLKWLNNNLSNSIIFSDPVFPTNRIVAESLLSGNQSNILTLFNECDHPNNSHNNSDNSDYLGQYLKKSPHHIDQLLEMLDGYLSTEIKNLSGSSNINTLSTMDLPSAIWDVIQSLPTHLGLLQQIKNIPNDKTGSIRMLLDLACPYRLLYTLQIFDKILTHLRVKNNSLLYQSIYEWSTKLLYIGSSEHIIDLLIKLLQQNKSNKLNDYNDISIFTITILTRILHHFLLYDPDYVTFQVGTQITKILNKEHNSNSTAASMSLDPSVLNNMKVPPGIVLSYLNINKLVYDLLDYLYDVVYFYNSNFNTNATKNLSTISVEALTEHILTIVFSLVIACEDGNVIFQEYGQYSHGMAKLINLICLANHLDIIKTSSCKKIFEYCCHLFYLSIDLSTSDIDSNLSNSIYYNLDISLNTNQKLLRYQLLENIYILVSTVVTNYINDSKRSNFNCKYIYSLLALIYSLRFSPEIIFTAESIIKINLNLFDYVNDAADNKFNSISNDLLNIFVKKLFCYNSLEMFHSNQSDGTLIGILRILLIFAKKFHSFSIDSWNITSLYSFLYQNCLFPSNSSTNSLCQTWESRNLIYGILYQLCIIDNSNLHNISRSIVSNCTNNKHLKVIQYNYDPNILARDIDAYVGLHNQGGTCYMNSFLQQLYNIPSFRNAILSIDIPNISNKLSESEINSNSEEEFLINNNMITSLTENVQNDILLFQLQVLFGYLQLSQKKSYNTLPFCKSFYDYDGQPISLIEQKDINEFASMLFDKLENTSVNDTCKYIFRNTFQGSLVYHTKSLESNYRSEKVENFYMITCEVKGKTCLEDSLELLVNEEQFSGDNKIEDPLLNRKVDATRRCAIRDLPNTLIIHLKRFEFDLETMDRKKVNDYITFPMDLDMYPYTEEGINMKEERIKQSMNEVFVSSSVNENRQSISKNDDGYENQIDIDNDVSDAGNNQLDDIRSDPVSQLNAKSHDKSYYNYTCVGIVAHVGAIDRGHYYSFIKDRNTSKWFEFNDRNVYPFSVETIPNECFGGEEQVQLSNGTISKRMKQNNAYLLYYEKVNLNNDSSNMYSNSRINDNIMSTLTSADINSNLKSKDSINSISKQVLDTIWYENTDFQTDRYIYNTYHYRFIYQLLLTIPVANTSDFPIDTLKTILLIGLKFAVEVVSTGRSVSCLPIFFDKINDIITSDSTNQCSYEIILELSNQKSKIANYYKFSNYLLNKKSVEEKELLHNVIHPWLALTYISCPHSYSIRAFSKLIVTCIKNIRNDEIVNYLHQHDIIKESNILTDSDNNESNMQPHTDANNHNKFSNIYTREDLDRFSSPVTRLLNSIITIIEKMPIESIYGRDGLHMLGGILYHVSSFGYPEKKLLLKIQTIYRLVCTLLHINPSQNKIPSDDLIYFIDLISLLIRSSAFTKTDTSVELSYQLASKSPFILPETLETLQTIGDIHILEIHDAQAFLNKVFLNESIGISPNKLSAAITHLCISRGGTEVIKVCEFLMEKLEESLLSNRGGSILSYRPYFKIMSDLLLSLESIQVYDLLIPGLISKADNIANRFGPHDPEFIYVVNKILLRIGLSSTLGYQYIKKYKEFWKRLRLKFLSIKRKGGPLYNPSDITIDQSNNVNNNHNSATHNKEDDFTPYSGFILGL